MPDPPRTNAEAKDAALRALDARRDEHVRLIQEFVRIRSTLGREKPAQAWIARQMRRLGLLVDQFDCDLAELQSLPGWTPFDHPYHDRPNVVGIWPSTGSGRSLILNAHVDTTEADPIERWSHDPWSGAIVGNRLYGRGSQDDKSGGVAFLMVVQALQDAGIRLNGPLILQSVIEEEITGNGTLACVARGYDADGAIVIDGTGLGRAIVTQAGQLAFHVTCHGHPAPLGSARRGVNAIEKTWLIVQTLRQLEARKNERTHPAWAQSEHPVNVNLWAIEGGEWLGTVAARCRLDAAICFLPPDTVSTIKTEIEAAVREAAEADPWLSAHPPVVGYDALAHDPLIGSPDSDLLRLLAAAHHDVTGQPLTPSAITGWGDLRHFSLHRPTPSCLFGPGGGGGAHGFDEWLDLDQIGPVTKTLAALVIDWCGVA